MTLFAVYSRRIDGREISGRRFTQIDETFATKAEARAWAVRQNSKPFTPFFFWVVEGAI